MLAVWCFWMNFAGKTRLKGEKLRSDLPQCLLVWPCDLWRGNTTPETPVKAFSGSVLRFPAICPAEITWKHWFRPGRVCSDQVLGRSQRSATERDFGPWRSANEEISAVILRLIIAMVASCESWNKKVKLSPSSDAQKLFWIAWRSLIETDGAQFLIELKISPNWPTSCFFLHEYLSTGTVDTIERLFSEIWLWYRENRAIIKFSSSKKFCWKIRRKQK